jgi:hypothetical protein
VLIELLMMETMMAAQTTRPAEALPADAVRVEARMATDKITADLTRAFDVVLEVDEGWSISTAGHPKAFLQVDAPPSVTLAGAVLESHQELARNGFLVAPFERVIGPGTTRVEFTIDGRPGDDERIGINVVAYVGRDGSSDAWFLRRRLELPLAAGAVAAAGDDRDTSWGDAGHDRDGLAVGDTADPLRLPRADGTMVDLADYRGRHVIITTYRAFW